MEKNIRHFATGLLSLILLAGLLTSVSLFRRSNSAEQEANLRIDRCDVCGGRIQLTIDLTDEVLDEHEVECEHYKWGTDLVGAKNGTCYGTCLDCGGSWQYPVSVPELIKCGGFIA